MHLASNPIKEKLARGETVLGTFAKFTDPAAAEILALSGFDFLLFDLEHSPVEVKDLENLIRACLLGGAAPLARVPSNRPEIILRAMDLGLFGIQVPHVENGQDAREALASVRYRHPSGRRGLAFSQRAAGYGAVTPVEYVRWVEEQTLLVVQVESLGAFDAMRDILKVDGVDVVFFGPADLSQSAGTPGRWDNPEVRRVIESAPKIIAEYPGKAAGLWVASPSDIRFYQELGYRYFAIGGDTGFLRQAAKTAVETARAQAIPSMPHADGGKG